MLDKQTLLNILNVRKEILNNNKDMFREILIEEIDFLIKRIEDGFFDIKIETKNICKWHEKEDKSTEVSCLSSHEKNKWKFCPFCGNTLDWRRAK